MAKTWADRDSFDGERRTDRVTCPCCGEEKAADKIVKLPQPKAAEAATVSERVGSAPETPWEEWPEWACTDHLSTILRHGIVRGPHVQGGKIPGQRVYNAVRPERGNNGNQ